MIVVVTGSRKDSAALKDLVFRTLDEIHAKTPIALLISGACVDRETGEMSGADRYAIEWCLSREVDFNGRPARWKAEGHPQAGPMRNGRVCQELATFKEHVLIQFPGGTGTANCVKQARRMGIRVQCVGWEVES